MRQRRTLHSRDKAHEQWRKGENGQTNGINLKVSDRGRKELSRELAEKFAEIHERLHGWLRGEPKVARVHDPLHGRGGSWVCGSWW